MTKMKAKFRVPGLVEIPSGISVGSFEFLIDGKVIPFEFEEYRLTKNDDGSFAYTSGDVFGDYYDEDYDELDISTDILTAQVEPFKNYGLTKEEEDAFTSLCYELLFSFV